MRIRAAVRKMLERSQIYLRPIKSLGQSFLINKSIAEAEAEHATGKNVLELGPGYGILTRELCKKAKHVVSVELDKNLFDMLNQEMQNKNLRLINKDFFEATQEELDLDKTDILIANVPYKLSSKIIDFLIENKLQAVLCLQKEFVQHMIAKPGTKNYSRLSVMFQLCFSFTKLVSVSRGNFRPMPKVDSVVIYVKPKESVKIGKEEKNVINAIMQHKKKTVKNAMLDSHASFRKSEKEIGLEIGKLEDKESRVFKLGPEEILKIARIVTGKST